MAATASLTESDAVGIAFQNAGSTGKRTKSIRVPPRIGLADITHNNVGTLRKLNSVLFPVSYSDRFYNDVLAPEVEDYCKLIYYNDIPVGAICCRIELDTLPETPQGATQKQPTGKLYLMTLGVLAPYRRQGLASKLVSHVFEKATEASLAASLTPIPAPVAPAPAKAPAKAEKASKGKGKAPEPAPPVKEDPPAPPAPILKNIFVHVQVDNDDAKAFWEQQGFKEKETVHGYYKPTIEGSKDAWLLEKEIDI